VGKKSVSELASWSRESIHARGAGDTQTKLDTEWDGVGTQKQKCNTMYLNSTIFLAPGVFLTPEIGYSDFNDSDEPEIRYFGIKWQINF